MTEEEKAACLPEYLRVVYTQAIQDAETHYKALYECFVANIPEALHRTGEYAPALTRPDGFSADNQVWNFYLDLPTDAYAPTFALFRYKYKAGRWKLMRFISRLGTPPFAFSEARNRNLSAAILSAREIFLQYQKAVATAATQSIDSAPSGPVM